MSNLTEHAKEELTRAGMFKKDGLYNGMLGGAVLELVKVFSKQGHSGMSASIVRDIFNIVSDYKTLTPLTFDDDEWEECYENTYQNKRQSSVFKEGKGGKPYFIDAFYKKTQTGTTWLGSLNTPEGVLTTCYIKDPKKMPTICLDVIDWEVTSGEWDEKMKDPTQLEELRKYYDLEFKGEK